MCPLALIATAPKWSLVSLTALKAPIMALWYRPGNLTVITLGVTSSNSSSTYWLSSTALPLSQPRVLGAVQIWTPNEESLVLGAVQLCNLMKSHSTRVSFDSSKGPV
jgi:hypothetical protein